MSEPFAAPCSELRVHPHGGLLAHAQAAFGEAVESLELFADKVAGSLRVHLLEHGVGPVGLSLAWNAAGHRRHDERRVLLQLLQAVIMLNPVRNHQRHARSLSPHEVAVTTRRHFSARTYLI